MVFKAKISPIGLKNGPHVTIQNKQHKNVILKKSDSRCGKWSELISESLIKFPSAFGVPPSVIKLTQAFWLLDHREFDDAMAMLLDPLVVPADITLGMLIISRPFLKP